MKNTAMKPSKRYPTSWTEISEKYNISEEDNKKWEKTATNALVTIAVYSAALGFLYHDEICEFGKLVGEKTSKLFKKMHQLVVSKKPTEIKPVDIPFDPEDELVDLDTIPVPHSTVDSFYGADLK